MRTATDIIDLLGGPTKVAKAVGFPLTTVHSWKAANFIPEWRRAALLKMAGDQGVSLATTDFPPIEERKPRPKVAA